MINMGSLCDLIRPALGSDKDRLSVDWVGDCLMLDGSPFVTRGEVQSGEFKDTIAQKIADYKARRASDL